MNIFELALKKRKKTGKERKWEQHLWRDGNSLELKGTELIRQIVLGLSSSLSLSKFWLKEEQMSICSLQIQKGPY